jgi:gamma-glutamylcyclotransferase (GGCT)/AIG2-like uncharacterized protein YtfP
VSKTAQLVLIALAAVLLLAISSLAAAKLGVTAEWLTAFAELTMAAGTVTAALWAVYSFRQAKTAEAARWVKDLFAEFFFNPSFDEIRDLLEFGYQSRLKPILQVALLGRYLQISSDEDRRLVKELDNFLNYLEYVLYLEAMGRIDPTDRKAIFDYWTGLLADADHALIRLYCSEFGYERVAALVNAPNQPQRQLLAVYGTLRKGEKTLEPLRFLEAMKLRGPCKIAGKLVDLGDYPGLVAGEGVVVGDLFEIGDLRLWHELDRYEAYDPDNIADSEYERVYCRLADPPLDSWVYRYVGAADRGTLVESGDWKKRSAPARP